MPGRIVAFAPIEAPSATVVLNSHAFDTARWRAGEAFVADRVPARSIDAGYEWMGTYAPGLAQFSERPIGGTGLTWYSGLWPEFRLCAFVSSIPVSVPGADLVRVDQAAYRLLLVGGPDSALYSYRVRRLAVGHPDGGQTAANGWSAERRRPSHATIGTSNSGRLPSE